MSEEAWRKAAESVLSKSGKNAHFHGHFDLGPDEPTAISPLLPSRRNAAPLLRRGAAGVRILSHVRLDDPDANAQALEDLAHGADGLLIETGHSAPARPEKTEGSIRKTMEGLLAGIDIDLVCIRLSGPLDDVASAVLADIVLARGLHPGRCDIGFNISFTGEPDLAARLSAHGFKGPFVVWMSTACPGADRWRRHDRRLHGDIDAAGCWNFAGGTRRGNRFPR